MNRYAEQKPPRWWPPKLSPFWFRVWKRLRRRQRVVEHQLAEVEVRGLDRLRAAIDAGHGMLITPNHSGHSDPQAMLVVADEVGSELVRPSGEARSVSKYPFPRHVTQIDKLLA